MTTKSNNVLAVEMLGTTMVVTPQGDSFSFRYNDIHSETNLVIAAIDRHDADGLVINFCKVGVIGSIMITSVVRLARKIGIRKGRAVFCCASPATKSVIQTMNLTRLWPYFETQDAAVAASMPDG
ncbi:MAG: anti-anti-sigma regulatory factor [Planctomycetaceae bacterium]|jgi:anti-anti-sigma regulatory factor